MDVIFILGWNFAYDGLKRSFWRARTQWSTKIAFWDWMKCISQTGNWVQCIQYCEIAYTYTIWPQVSTLVLQHDRAYQDEDIKVSYVKFCSKILNWWAITHFIYLAVSDTLQSRCLDPLFLAIFFFFLVLWKEGKCPLFQPFGQGHFLGLNVLINLYTI